MRAMSAGAWILMASAWCVLSGPVEAGRSQEARDASTTIAALTNELNARLDTFQKSRDLIATGRMQSLVALERLAVAAEGEVRDRSVFFSRDQDELLDTILEMTDENVARRAELEVIAREQQARIAAARSRSALRPEKLGEVAKILAKLGEKPDLEATVEEYIAFFKEVKAGLEAEEEQADQNGDPDEE